MQLRLLPVTLSVAALLLVSKTINLGLAFVPAAVVASAEAAPAHEASEPAAAISATKAVATPAAAPHPTRAMAEPSSPPAPVISDAERQLLQDLRGRRQELDAREQTMAQREAVLNAAEQRLSERVGQLTALQARLESLEKERQDHDEANWAGLVKVYETMKPRDAAAIFNDMDMNVLLHVVDRMKEAKAALVLAAMQPDRARLVTTQLAAQRTRSTTVPPEHSGAG